MTHRGVPRLRRILAETGWRALAAALLAATAPLAVAQSSYDLHPRIDGRTYHDDKISVRVPAGWALSIDQQDLGGGQTLTHGLVLRHGRYVLRLCTGCAQVSGIVGGRFAEIAGMVQPWFRSDAGANPSYCGKPVTTHISAQIDRIDFWFRRDPAHVYNEDADDCRQPRTTATVWYGSYFAERCPAGMVGRDCGGYFLHLDWLTRHDPDNPTNEMAFALTADADSPDGMPLQSDPELARILREASAIVGSAQFHAPQR
jgi:hypothetical protein